MQQSFSARSIQLVRLNLAIYAAVVAWHWGVAAADPPRIQAPATWIIPGNRSLPAQSEIAIPDDEAEELVPISRVVPRVKTIPPGYERARRLPPGYENDYKNTEAWSPTMPGEESQADEEGINENELPPRIQKNVPARAPERRSSAHAQPRTKFAVQATAAPAAIEPAESRANGSNEDQPEGPEPTAIVAAPELTADALVPEIPVQIIDEPWPQDPRDYDTWPCPPQGVNDCHCWGPIRKFLYFNQTNGDIGIGHERVMFAPFEIETSQPANNFRLKAMSAFDLRTPDRAEYLWAKIGGSGPRLPERSVNYQNYDAIYEAGGNRFSFVTDIPLRNVQPEVNISGAGIGNISLAPKVVLVNGNDWQISTLFRTYLPTGAAQRGTSNGLTSLEPGVLVRYRWSPRTYVHGQLKYWIPLAADPIASGNVFNYALGVSHVLHETDSFAIIPVLEFVGWTVGGGTATLPSGLTTSANTSFVNIQPGVRFVLGPKGDLGLCELGISGGFATDVTGWYQEQFTVELRWSW